MQPQIFQNTSPDVRLEQQRRHWLQAVTWGVLNAEDKQSGKALEGSRWPARAKKQETREMCAKTAAARPVMERAMQLQETTHSLTPSRAGHLFHHSQKK